METKLTPWKIEWQNDTGPNDDFYVEWFTVSNGIVEYECDTQEDAEELVKTLTEHSQLLQQRDKLMEALMKLKDEAWRNGVSSEYVHEFCKETIQKHQI